MTITDNIKQDDGQTPVDSQTNQQPAGDTTVVSDAQQTTSSQSDGQKTSEEIVWESLKGGTQERIKQLIRERDEYKSKITQQAQQDDQRLSQQYQQPSQPQQPVYGEDDVTTAVQTLKEKGKFATQDDLYALLFQVERGRDHDRLEGKYDGSDGLPKYDRVEVEDYMRKNGMTGRPEAAYRDMYFDELVDADKKQIKKKPAITSEKPTASSQAARNEPMSLETLREQLASPKGREVYAKLMKNPQQFDSLLQQLSQ